MVLIRIIPCLDVDAKTVVKGIHFQNLREVGDPVALALDYYNQGADELVYLDVSASVDGRQTMYDTVRRTAGSLFIPLTVGGGVRSVSDVARLLKSGADKVSVNTAALQNPALISEISRTYGRQILVLSVDCRRATDENGKQYYEVTTHGGRKSTGIDAKWWTLRAIELGVGEVLLNSMDADGSTSGFDLEMTRDFRSFVTVPLIASGGAGKVADFVDVARLGVDAILAASVFHYGLLTVAMVKEALSHQGFLVR